MDQFKALPLSIKIMFGAGVLLLIDSFFAWQKISVSVGGVEIAAAKANAWHGFWGVLMALLTIGLLFWVAAHALELSLPGGIPQGVSTLAFGIAIFVCALLKNLTDDYSAWASYVGIVLAAILAYGAWLAFQESGESLPSMPTGGARVGATAAPAAAAPAATTEPAPSVPEPEPPTTPARTDPA